MPANYPNSLAVLTNPNASDYQNVPSHSQIETQQNLEIVALQTELGLGLRGSLTNLAQRINVSLNADGSLKAEGYTLDNLSDVSIGSGGPLANQLLRYTTAYGWHNWTPNYLTSYTESDPIVKAINGIVKSNGTTIAAAVAGTDYLAPVTPSLSTDHTASGTIITLTAGTALVFGDVCYMGSDGKMEKGDADLTGNLFPFAICLATIAENATGQFALLGFVRDDTWNWTSLGLPVFLSATAGGLTQTAPSATAQEIQVIGIAITADIIYFNPQLMQAKHI